MRDDVVVILVMLLSGLRCLGCRRTLFLGLGFGFSAAAFFFSSLSFFFLSFSASLFSLSCCRLRMMFIDCSDVRTLENVVGMPTRR